jgi:predicted nuclease of predicted toxin-antitoxin system
LVVTKYADFSDPCILLGFPPKVIWIRHGNRKTTAIEAMLRYHYTDIKALNEDRVIGVLTLF